MLLIVTLTVRRDQLDEFRRYEHAAATIMKQHAGVIEHAYVIDDGGDTLREVHVVRFRDDDAFAAYRTDPDLVTMRSIRERCIVATEINRATDGPIY